MRPIPVTVSAAGNSQWIPVNRLGVAFALGLAGIPSSGASLTWKVQHTFDQLDEDATSYVAIARAAGVATLTLSNHGASVGDSLVVEGCGAPFDGVFDVASVVDANNVTYAVSNSGLTASIAGGRAKVLRVFDHATLVGQTGRADGNYAFPVTAVRFVITAFASGFLRGEVVQGMGW